MNRDDDHSLAPPHMTPNNHDNRTEARLERLESRAESLEIRVSNVESQVGRITSHIESEIGLTRTDLSRIETRLFGSGDDEYGGRVGQMTRRIYKVELAILSISGATGIILFLVAVYQFLSKQPVK